MKANELREGNYFKDQDGEVHQLKRLDFEENRIDFTLGYGDGDGSDGKYIWNEDALPIIITEEWLKKFGFTREEFRGNIGKYRVFKKGLFVYNSNSKWWYNDRQLPNHIKYIHQLQNLYFVLTNEELIYTP